LIVVPWRISDNIDREDEEASSLNLGLRVARVPKRRMVIDGWPSVFIATVLRLEHEYITFSTEIVNFGLSAAYVAVHWCGDSAALKEFGS